LRIERRSGKTTAQIPHATSEVRDRPRFGRRDKEQLELLEELESLPLSQPPPLSSGELLELELELSHPSSELSEDDWSDELSHPSSAELESELVSEWLHESSEVELSSWGCDDGEPSHEPDTSTGAGAGDSTTVVSTTTGPCAGGGPGSRGLGFVATGGGAGVIAAGGITAGGAQSAGSCVVSKNGLFEAPGAIVTAMSSPKVRVGKMPIARVTQTFAPPVPEMARVRSSDGSPYEAARWS
jgi:hypothetical protein